MPTCDSLGEGLWEVRTTLEDRIARVFFCMFGSRMVFLHALIKKSRTAPQVDLKTARKRKRNLEERLRDLEKHHSRTRR